MNEIVPNMKLLAERIVQAPFASGEFYTLLGVAAFLMLIVGTVINAALIGKNKGFLIVYFAQLLILVDAFIAAALVQTFAASSIGNANTLDLVMVAVAILTGWFTFSILRKPMMDAGWATGVAACLFVFAIGYAGLWVGDEVFGLLEQSQEKVNELKKDFSKED